MSSGPMSSRPVSSHLLVSLRVSASPAHAFEVFTRDIGLWWQPNGLFRFSKGEPGLLAFEKGEGGRFTETMASGEVFEIGRITAWEPGGRLAFTWRQASFAPGQETRVEIRFEALGEETRVTVESITAGTASRRSMWRAMAFPTASSCAAMRNGGRCC